MAHQVIHHVLGLAAAAHQHGDAAPVVAAPVLRFYFPGHGLQRGFLELRGRGIFFVAGQSRVGLDAHACAQAVEFAEERLAHVFVAGHVVKGRQAREQSVVEAHHAVGAAMVGIVGRSGAAHDVAPRKLLGHAVVQQAAVGVAEAVYRLLFVAYDQAVGGVDAIGHERAQIVPLHHACVLKLVDQEVV